MQPISALRKKYSKGLLCAGLIGTIALFSCTHPEGQNDFADGRVLLQGFYWESYRHGHPGLFPSYGDSSWYALVSARAATIRAGRFDLVWLPPPSYAGETSAGYNPKTWFRLDNSYGSANEHKTLLRQLLAHGVEPIADIVINHRDGLMGWAHFVDPAWGTDAICSSDEAFTNEGSEVFGTPIAQRGREEERPEYAGHDGTTYAYPAFRDIDHSNPTVRRDIIRYLKWLQSVGYRGWRYDMVHGYHARWLAAYNRATQPSFSVGEYDWDQRAAQRGWIERSATQPNDLRSASHLFDFTSFFFLKDHKEEYQRWYDKDWGLTSDTTNGFAWKSRAVTFLENHDTGYRTNEDGSPQEHHHHDSFQRGGELERAYAYILTHPGVPSVFWPHYFSWGDDLQAKIRALINARKVAGVHANSPLHLAMDVRAEGVYAARVQGEHGQLFVRIGDQRPWPAAHSARLYAKGEDWQVWVELAGWRTWLGLAEPPPVRQAPLATPIHATTEEVLLSRADIADAWIEAD